MYNNIKTLIDTWDPLGLLAMGCPKDEYESEIAEIQNLVHKEDSEEKIAETVHQIFSNYFGEIFDRTIEDCKSIAKQIKEYL